MSKKISIFTSSVFVMFISLFALPVLAFKDKIDPITPGITSVPQFLKNVLDIAIQIGIPISAFFMIWAGFLFLTAQGDPTRLTTAKRAFVWAVVGTAVIFCAWLLAMAIQNTIWQEIGGNQVP